MWAETMYTVFSAVCTKVSITVYPSPGEHRPDGEKEVPLPTCAVETENFHFPKNSFKVSCSPFLSSCYNKWGGHVDS